MKSEETIKSRMQTFIDGQTSEVITETKEQEILCKRKEFLELLKMEGLNYLFDLTREKTAFEWKCFVDILNLLMGFDDLIEQHDIRFGKPIDNINERLRRLMTYYSDEYDSSEICYSYTVK